MARIDEKESLSSVTPVRNPIDGRSRAGAENPFADAFALALSQASSARGAMPESGHIPLAGRHGDDDIHVKALKLRIQRQQLIASNIANADTPGYKAVDIDIEQALLAGQASPSHAPLKLTTSAPSHISGNEMGSALGAPLKYRVPRQPGIDGNTVDMDVERAKFSENALMLQFAMDRVGGHAKEMLELLKNLK